MQMPTTLCSADQKPLGDSSSPNPAPLSLRSTCPSSASPTSVLRSFSGNQTAPPPPAPPSSCNILVGGSSISSAACSRMTSFKQANNCRNEASEIVAGFLFLGSARVACNAEKTSALKITRYLCCAREASLPTHVPSKNLESGEVQVCHIPMKDGATTQLTEHFSEAFAFLQAARQARQRVLVYCREGKSRSASIVIAYFIKYFHMSYEEALGIIRQRRSVVDPNYSFCTQLSDFAIQVTEGDEIGMTPKSVLRSPNLQQLDTPNDGVASVPNALLEDTPREHDFFQLPDHISGSSHPALGSQLLSEEHLADLSWHSLQGGGGHSTLVTPTGSHFNLLAAISGGYGGGGEDNDDSDVNEDALLSIDVTMKALEEE